MAPILDEANVADVWLTVEDAVALGASRRTLWRHLGAGKISSRVRAGTREREFLLESLASDVQLRYAQELARRMAEQRTEVAAQLDETSAARLAEYNPETAAALKAEIARRCHLLESFSRECRRHRAPDHLVEAFLRDWPARDRLVLAARPSWGAMPTRRTLVRALDRYDEIGAAALLPPPPPRAIREDDKRVRPIDEDVRDGILQMRLVTHRNAEFEPLYRRLKARFGDRLPSRSTVRRFLSREVSTALDVYARKGPKTYRATTEVHLVRDWSHLDVCEMLCGDHHQIDVEVRDVTDGDKLKRPWLTAWLDLKTRAPVGWTFSFQPNAQTIVAAFCHAVREKKDRDTWTHLWGLPDGVYVDNGKDYRSQRLEGDGGFGSAADSGLFQLLGVKVTHAIAYNAKAKPVERWFKTLCGDFSKCFNTYCGNSPAARTERYREDVATHERWLKKERGAQTSFMSLQDLERHFDAWIVDYLKRQHKGLYEENSSRTFSPFELAAQRRRPARAVDPQTLAVLAWTPIKGGRTVERSSIRIGRIRYTCDELLGAHGHVECRRDPKDVSRLFVVTERGESFFAEAMELSRTVPGGSLTESDIKQLERKKRDEKKIRERYLEIREAEISGVDPLDEIASRRIAAPPPIESGTSSSSAPPVGAVRAISSIEKQVREARARHKAPAPIAAPEQPPAPPIPAPIAAPRTLEERAEELVAAELGPRPVVPAIAFAFEREIVERDLAFWMNRFAEVSAQLASPFLTAAAAKGGPR